MIGPFHKAVLHDTCYSPLNSVPKKDSQERRLILDLSMPQGNAINDGIDKDYCLGTYEKLSLPSVDNLVERIVELGPGCLLFKVDLSRAYRQILNCPGEVHFLGYIFNGEFYYDISLSMGSKASAKACQLVTTAVVFIFTNYGYFAVNYLDDLGSAETPVKATTAYTQLLTILDNFGLTPALHKCVPPCTKMTFLGIEVNSISMTIKIPREKWEEIQHILAEWAEKEQASRHDIQILAGHLNFAGKCIKSGRVYLSRILNFLRELPKIGKKPIPQSVKEDIEWWRTVAPLHNGVSLIINKYIPDPDKIISSDSCLTGGGCYCQGEFAHWKFPQEITSLNRHINELESLMVTIALKLWGDRLARMRVTMLCDNKTTVHAINSGSSKNIQIQKCLRELHKLMALFDCEIKAEFIKGESNRIADNLSRWHVDKKYETEFYKLTVTHERKERLIKRDHWKFFL